MRHIHVLGPVAAVAALVSACGQSAPAAPARMVIDGNLARTYASVPELVHDSTAVVELTATDRQSVSYRANMPYTVTMAQVVRVLRGHLDNTTIDIREVGMPSTSSLVVDGPQVLLSPGKTYVAFVTPFTFGNGQATGQYVVVGTDAGLYSVTGGDVAPVNPAMHVLSSHTTLADVQRLVNAA